MHLDTQVMLVFSPKHAKPVFVDFEGDTEPVEATDAHMIALHEVVHHVFEAGLHACAVEYIEEDLLLRRYLKA